MSTVDNVYIKEIAALRQQLEEKEFIIRDLRKELAQRDVNALAATIQVTFGLTNKEARIVSLMSDGLIRPADVIWDTISDHEVASTRKIIDVYICRIRQKLRYPKILINTRSAGFTMPKVWRDKITALIEVPA